MRFLVLLFITLSANGATWYVRPGVWTGTLDANNHPVPTASVYGSQDGTTYANAWNGLTSIVWNGGGINAGDTLYICGLHIYAYKTWSASFFTQGISTNWTSGITIRMDYPGDKGTIFGGTMNFHDPTSAWMGPDVNGVYWQTIQSQHQQTFEFDGTNIDRMKAKSAVTWTDGPGQFYLTGTNYVKMSTGLIPTTNTTLSYQYGWAIDLNRQSNIVFQSCNFISDNPIQWGGLITKKPSYSGPAANHITFTNCTFFDSGTLWVYPDEDNWSFINCELGRMNSAIYTIIDGQNRGAHRLTVTGCYIHDTDTAEYPDTDGHAVGIQGGNYHLIQSNRTERTGAAIVLWTGSAAMSNATITGNFVRDMHIRSDNSGGGDGIAVSGDNTLAVAGLRTGIVVSDNIILNAGLTSTNPFAGRGITVVNKDATDVLNNTIVNAYIGLRIEPTGAAILGRFINNIIASPSTVYVTINGASYGTFSMDNNLYYPASDVSSGFSASPSHSFGSANVFASPGFMSPAYASASAFMISSASAARGHGASVGLTTDCAGFPFASTPSIGAMEYEPPNVTIGTLNATKAVFY
jgi:hypothetical protein